MLADYGERVYGDIYGYIYIYIRIYGFSNYQIRSIRSGCDLRQLAPQQPIYACDGDLAQACPRLRTNSGFLPLCHQRANKSVKETQQLGGLRRTGIKIEIKGLCTAGRGFVPCLYLYNVQRFHPRLSLCVDSYLISSLFSTTARYIYFCIAEARRDTQTRYLYQTWVLNTRLLDLFFAGVREDPCSVPAVPCLLRTGMECFCFCVCAPRLVRRP